MSNGKKDSPPTGAEDDGNFSSVEREGTEK